MKVHRHLSADQYAAFMRRLEAMKHTHTELALAFYLLAVTGARCQEILKVESVQLNDHDKSLSIVANKGSSDRTLPLDPDWYDLLAHFSRGRRRIFNFNYTAIRRAWLSFRTADLPLHSLRHTRGIRAYEATKDIYLVREVLGHRNIENTLVYVNFVNSKENKKAAMK